MSSAAGVGLGQEDERPEEGGAWDLEPWALPQLHCPGKPQGTGSRCRVSPALPVSPKAWPRTAQHCPPEMLPLLPQMPGLLTAHEEGLALSRCPDLLPITLAAPAGGSQTRAETGPDTRRPRGSHAGWCRGSEALWQ